MKAEMKQAGEIMIVTGRLLYDGEVHLSITEQFSHDCHDLARPLDLYFLLRKLLVFCLKRLLSMTLHIQLGHYVGVGAP